MIDPDTAARLALIAERVEAHSYLSDWANEDITYLLALVRQQETTIANLRTGLQTIVRDGEPERVTAPLDTAEWAQYVLDWAGHSEFGRH